MISTYIVCNLSELANFSRQWNALASRSCQQLPTLSYAWVSTYLEHRLRPEEQWFVVLASDGEEIVGVLPLIVVPYHFAGCATTILRTAHDPHTQGGDLIVAPGQEAEIIPLLLTAVSEYHSRYVYIQFSNIVESSATLRSQACLPQGMTLMSTSFSYGSYLPIKGDFDSYRKSLSTNLQGTLRKARNKLRKLPGMQTVFLGGPDATKDSLGQFATVEAHSWKRDSDSAILLSPQLMAFYESLTNRLSEAGWLEWHFLEADGQIIAGNMAVRLNRSLFLWKIGYDAQYSKYSPGSILFEELVRRMYESGETDEINMVSDQSWQMNWQPVKRPYFQVRIYRRGIIPKIHRLRDLGVRYLKSLPLARKSVQYLRAMKERLHNA